MANVTPAPSWMGSSAKAVTGQEWMGNARLALRLPFAGWMSEMGGRGVDTLGFFGRRNVSGNIWEHGVWGNGAYNSHWENSENVGLGMNIWQLVLNTGYNLCAMEVYGGETGGNIKVFLDDIQGNFTWTNTANGRNMWLNNGVLSGAWVNKIKVLNTATRVRITR